MGGVGAQDMVFRRFAVATGVDVAKTRAIALKGGAEAVTMTAGGHVQLGTGTWSAIAAPLSAGKLRVLAVAGPERWPKLDAPTTKEAGIPDIEVVVLDRHLRPARPARRHRGHLGRGAQGACLPTRRCRRRCSTPASSPPTRTARP